MWHVVMLSARPVVDHDRYWRCDGCDQRDSCSSDTCGDDECSLHVAVDDDVF